MDSVRENIRTKDQPKENGQEENEAAKRKRNRDLWGTWRNPYDFTVTVLGYVMGIYNLWRFPYLCYKFGGAFFVPFFVVLFFVGIPMVFMEFTIGQYFSVGPYEACSELAPILTGVSHVLVWHSMITCVLYAMIMSVSRFYASEATRCKKGWETCNPEHYYNTPECFTGEQDDRCEDVGLLNSSSFTFRHNDQIFFQFDCVSADEFCEMFDAEYVPGSKTCRPLHGSQESFSIFERRANAATEHFYGGIIGLQRRKEAMRKENRYNPRDAQNYQEGQELVVNNESGSGIQLKLYSLTTWLLLAIFLYEGLLHVSAVTYLLNAASIVLLLIFTSKALSLSQAITGVEELALKRDFLGDLQDLNMWAEAIIQVIGTMGLGTGVLITLATFNKYHHKYLFESYFIFFMNFLTSFCATLICFCTIGHYINYFRINIPFSDYIMMESTSSSIEFGYIAYTHFMTLIHNQSYAIIMFFFMITSFSTDSSLRLLQTTLDTLVAMYPCLSRRRFTALLGICSVGFIALFPMTQNGGLIILIEYEYFTLSFVSPLVCFIEVSSFSWIYGAGEIATRAKEMKIVSSKGFHLYLYFCLKFCAPFGLLFVLAVKAFLHSRIRFNKRPTSWTTELIFWVFTSVPLLILAFEILKQIVLMKMSNGSIKMLFQPLRRATITTPLPEEAPTRLQNEEDIPGIISPNPNGNDSLNDDPMPNTPEIKPTDPVPVAISRRNSVINSRSYTGGSKKDISRKQKLFKRLSEQPVEDEVIAMDNTQGERWKVSLMSILHYFEQWPGRFDESSSELDESEESDASASSDGR